MSNVQIPNLPVAIALNGTEALEAVQSGTSVQTTVAGIAQYSYAYYPGFYISQLPAASSSNSTDILPVLQGSTGPGTGTTRKITPGQLSVTATGSTTSRTFANRFADTVNVLDWGVSPTHAAAVNATAFQALLDANPNGNIFFPPSTSAYNILGPVYLSDSTGRNFGGTISGFGATIVWTNDGNTTDADAATQRGLCAYPRTLTIYSDITGIVRCVFEGLTFIGPTNGIALYLANSQNCHFDNLKFGASRYNIVNETCINMLYEKVNFSSYINAGLGLLMLNDTARVYYGEVAGVPNANPATTYWNDSPSLISCSFQGERVGGIGHILDHGSQAEGIRICEGTYFYSSAAGAAVYGIVSRNGNWRLSTDWWENINYPVRIVGSNASEGGSGTPLTGVTTAQPSGTYTIGNFPDGYAYYFHAESCFTSKCVIDYNLDGVQAPNSTSTLGPNISANSTGYYVQSTLSSQCTILDLGVSFVNRTGGYQNISFSKYVFIPSLWTISGPVTVNAATYTVGLTDYSIIFTTTACTVTLPNPAFCSGRILKLQNISNIAVLAAGGNVTPLGSAVPGASILAATAGKYAEIQADGALNLWRTLQAN